MDVDSGDTVPADFHKEKIGRPSGVLRGIPRWRFCILLSPGTKGCGRAFDGLFRRIAFVMRGQPAIPVFFRFGLRATFFLHTKKEGKDVPRGNPLEPRVACRLSFQESRREGGHPYPPIYKKGAAAPGFGVAVFFQL